MLPCCMRFIWGSRWEQLLFITIGRLKYSFGDLYNLILFAHDLVQPPLDENVNRVYMLDHQKQEAMIFDITVWKLPVCMISQHTISIGMYV